MGAYTELTDAGTTTRTAAALTGLPRATATRRAARPTPVGNPQISGEPAHRP